MKDLLANFFDRYGLSFIMVASYFGSGSIFIASQAGVEYGYVLIWAVVGAVMLGFMAQDMSARLGIFGDTLMTFIRKKLGKQGALAVAVFLSIGCILWTIELTAAVGKSFEILMGGAVSWRPLAVATGLCAVVVGLLNYKHVEKVMTAMMFVLLFLYLAITGASGASIPDIASGFIPSIPDAGALVLGAAILGTTALWPNFFLESILVKKKGWNSAKHVKSMRSDLAMGYTIGGLITLAIIIVAAAVLRPAGYTELTSFIAPGVALEMIMGQWAMVVFLVGVIAAAFNSIVPIMWTVPYMVMEALDLDHENGESSTFKWIFAATTFSGVFSPWVADITGLSVIEMVTLFPAYNGAFALPVTALFLFWAVNDRKLMGTNTNNWKLNVANVSLVVFSLYIAVTSGKGVLQAIFGGMLA